MKNHTFVVGVFLLLIACIFIIVISANPIQSSNPLRTILIITVLNAAVSFFFALSTNDYSWTDRLWSTVPVGFVWIYASSHSYSPAITLAALLATVWGIRLTANFARRGGYSNNEDYRWSILRKRIENRFLFQVFNLLFIAIYQQLLFVCFTIPFYFLSLSSHTTINGRMLFASLAMLCCLLLETIADQQQYTFQQSKYGLMPKIQKLNEDYKRGFRTCGLFARSRHPNYFGELGFWWSLYLYCAFATESYFGPILLGPVMLTLLFIGSTIFTEQITASKYPQYKEYKKQAWPILFRPW
jgi:steroid 5-alpha reductase family enzyme